MPRIAIVGSRTFKDYELLASTIEIFFDSWRYQFGSEPFTIISGGAQGADQLAEHYWEELQEINKSVVLKVIKPDYDKHGKQAPLIRNTEIVELADMVVVFWNKKSRGSRDMIKKTIDRNKPLLIVPFQE